MSHSSGSNQSVLSQPIGLPFVPAWMSINVALLILMGVFFCIPFALRAARLSLESMKNDVKDWLPATFGETADLEWFREHFMGEQFILVSWPHCTGMYYDEAAKAELEAEHGPGFQAVTDVKFKLFLDKLQPEVPPSKRASVSPRNEAEFVDGELHFYTRQLTVEDTAWRAGFVGDRLGLYVANVPAGEDPYYTNWGGAHEKWVKGRGNVWYFIKPEPENADEVAEAKQAGKAAPPRRYALYRWDGQSTLLGGFYRDILRRTLGTPVATGDKEADFHPLDGEWYYSDPRRLSALWFKTVTTGPGALSRMLSATESQYKVKEDDARARLQGSLFGVDLTPKDREGKPIGPQVRQTCMILTLTDAAKKELGQTCGRGILGKPLGQLYRLADEIGLGRDEIKLGGPPVDNVAIDEEGQVTLVNLIWYSMAVGLGLTYFLLRSVYQTIMVFFVGGISAVIAMGIVYWSGQSVDAILLTMPGLVYVLGISGTLHLLNYYRLTAKEDGVAGAAERAARHTFWPAMLCAFTSSLGLFSLLSSEITPIWKFGLFSGIGTLATLILLFTYLPAALETWPTARQPAEEDEEDQAARTNPTWWQRMEQGYEQFMDDVPGRICDFLLANRTVVAITCAIAAVFASAGVFRLRTEIQLLKMFDQDTKIINDYAWLEQNLGKLVPMEVVVRVDPTLLAADPNSGDKSETDEANEAPPAEPTLEQRLQLSFLERLEAAESLRQLVEVEFGEEGRDIVGKGMAASTFAPKTPGLTSRLRYPFNLRLVRGRDELVGTDYLCTEKESEPETGDGTKQTKWKLGETEVDPTKAKYEPGKPELWRISLRLGALNNVDYGFFVGLLKSGIEPALAAYEQRTKILTKLAGGQSDGVFEKKAVLLVGANLVRRQAAAPATTAPAAGEGQPDGAPGQPDEAARQASQHELTRPLDAEEQTRIFVSRLRPLLIARQVKAEVVDVTLPDAPKGEDLAAAIAAHDCVVIVGEIPAEIAAAVEQQAGAKLHDCRREQVLFHEADTESGFTPTSRERHVAMHAIYSGVVPVVYKAQRTLLNSLNESFIWSMLTITPTMMLILVPGKTLLEKLHPTNLFFGFCGGAIAMIPNVFPVAMVFGVMGYMGVVIDLGTMMTASVAVGIAVDDTIHYLNYFREGLNEGMTKEEAIREGYKRCALSFIQTSLICGLGLGVFAFSSFTPTQRFGSMMVVLLLTAVFGDLLFLPALLAGPFGWFFRPDPAGLEQKPEGEAPAEATTAEAEQPIAATNLARETASPPAAKPEPRPPGPAAAPVIEPSALEPSAPGDAESNGEDADAADHEPPARESGKPATRHSPLRSEAGRKVRHDRPHEGPP